MAQEDSLTSVAGYFVPKGKMENNDPFDLVGPDLPDGVTPESVHDAIQEFTKVTGLPVIMSVMCEGGKLLPGFVRGDLITDQMRPGRVYLIPTNLGVASIYCTSGGGYAGATVVFPKGEPIYGVEAELKKRDDIQVVDKGNRIKQDSQNSSSIRVMAVLMSARGIVATHRIMQMIQPPNKLLLELRIVEEGGDMKVKFGILMNGDEPTRPLNDDEWDIIAAHRDHAASGMFVLDKTMNRFLFMNLAESNIVNSLLKSQAMMQMPVPIDKPGHVVSARADGIMDHFDKLTPATAAFFRHVFCGKK